MSLHHRRLCVVFAAVVAWSSVAAGVLSAAVGIDPARLPLGDGRVSAAPERGAVWSCQTRFPPNGPGAQVDGPWIRPDGTWDATAKISVAGSVRWPDAAFTVVGEGDTQVFVGNGLPFDHETGAFPVARDDPAFAYDRNPNRITPQRLRVALPVNPVFAAEPRCLPMGPVGVTVTGVVVYNALDARGRDAAAHEVLDACGGHPEVTGEYHYHELFGCVQNAALPSGFLGYAFDGFGIYIERDANGDPLTNADLDECHGRTSEIEWNGVPVSIYHYVATREYPYTVGCFRGTPAPVLRPPPSGLPGLPPPPRPAG